MWPRNSVVIASAMLFGGCSYGYDLRAIVRGGRLAFVVDPNSTRKAECIRSIHVKVADNEKARATPESGDAIDLVANGVFWWTDYAVDACPNKFPVLYGQRLEGHPFIYANGDTSGVEAKPLRIGVIYEADTSGSGSGYGWVRFRIRADRTVENLPSIDAIANITKSQ